jgi:hypothetical protein
VQDLEPVAIAYVDYISHFARTYDAPRDQAVTSRVIWHGHLDSFKRSANNGELDNRRAAVARLVGMQRNLRAQI